METPPLLSSQSRRRRWCITPLYPRKPTGSAVRIPDEIRLLKSTQVIPDVKHRLNLRPEKLIMAIEFQSVEGIVGISECAFCQ